MKLSFKNIGMITEAELNIDKLTIIAGQNDSGKSTIGKVLFGITNGMINLEKTFKKYKKIAIYNNLREIRKRLIGNEEWRKKFIKQNYDYIGEAEEELEFEFEFGMDVFDEIFEIEDFQNHLFEGDENIFNILKTYLLKNLKEEDIIKYIEDLDKVMKYSTQDEIIQKYALRQALNLEFDNQINSCFGDEKAEIKLENDEKIFLELEILNNINISVKIFKELYTKDIAYIEGAYVFEEYYSKRKLFRFEEDSLKNRIYNLKEKIEKSFSRRETNYIEMASNEERKQKFEEILNNSIGGTFRYSEKFESFVLEKNGKEIMMSNIAMGIKSLSILNTLLKINFFKQDNILIIDEPEIHLHPKWQIEYAKIITSLAKTFDTKIIITSHSPYMIEAFQKISEKEEMSKNTNFYLLEKTGNISKVENVNDNLEKIYSELGSAFSDLDKITLGDL